MTCPALLVLTAGLLLGADPPADAVKKELEKFEGTWQFVSIDIEGTKLPDEALKQSKLTIKGDKFTVTVGNETYGGSFKVDPTKKPKMIEVSFSEGPDKGKVSLGIYELEGDTYRICVDVAGKGRPTEFVSKPGSGHVLETLKRVKP